MQEKETEYLVSIDVDRPIWDHFYMVHPLIVIGSREPDGSWDLAPKHMAMPLGWQNYFGFVCTPQHRTHTNIAREQAFTVSFPRPGQIVQASLAATPRCHDNSKPVLKDLATIPAKHIEGIFLRDAYICLECELERIIDGFGENSLIAGRIVAAHVAASAMRTHARGTPNDRQTVPMLAFLAPDRFAYIRESHAFPFPANFKR